MPLIPEFCEHDTDFLEIIEPLLENENLCELNKVTHHYHTTRLRHSFYVAYVSYKLAKKYNLDAVSTARAGILHDFFLENRDEIHEMKKGSHSEVHPKIALENAKGLTNVNELEEDIILSHMFMTCIKSPVPRYKESFIVSMVDIYCAVSEFFIPVVNFKFSRLKSFIPWGNLAENTRR